MWPLADKPPRRWFLLVITAALAILLVGLVLVPPGTLPFRPKSFYSDAQVSHWPDAYLLRWSVLEHGEWPFWNPTRMLGQPFAANPLSKVWYPPQWLVLVVPPTFHLDLLIYLHLAWLAVGMVVWSRTEHLAALPALFTALGWGLNPKLVDHLGAGHLDILYGLAWLPWVMWAVRRATDLPLLASGIRLGVFVALMALGDVRIAVYFTPVIALYAISIGALQIPARTLLSVWGSAVSVIILLTAVQFAPLVSLGPYLTRASISPQDAAEWSLPPRYLLGLLLPDVGGIHEWMTYLGLPVIVLAVTPLADPNWRRKAVLWLGLAVVALLWALGNFGPLFLPVVSAMPVLTWLRVPSRAWFVVAFIMILLSGRGLNYVLGHGLGKVGRLAAVGLSVAGLTALFGTMMLPSSSRGLILGVGGALLGTGVGLWLAEGAADRVRRIGGCVLLATLVVSLLGLDLTLIVPHSIAQVEAQDYDIIDRMDPDCRYVYSPTFELIGPATTASGMTTLQGVDPFQLQATAEMIARIAGTQTHGYSVIAPPMPPGEFDLTGVKPDVTLLRMIGVCAVVSSFPLSVNGLEVERQVGEVMIYRVTGAADTVTTDSVANAIVWRPKVFGFKSTSVEACITGQTHAAPAAEIIVPQSWVPGWQASMDGRPSPVTPVMGGAFLSIGTVPSGCHTVTLAYRPMADLVGLIISSLSAVGLAVWFALRHVARRDNA